MSPVFEYEAMNTSGEKISGRLEVDRSSMVARQLKENGYYVTDIKEAKQKQDVGEFFKNTGRVKTKDLTVFSHMFASMIDAGISLVECLNIIQEETEHPKLKEVLRGVQEDIETGTSLSESLMRYPKVFPTLYCQLVKAGETGGVLDKVLNQLADHYERQDEINGKVKAALYYPIVILSVAILIVIFLMVVVVPTFVNMFSEMGGTLPLPTRILLGISTFLTQFWWIIIIVIASLISFFYIYKRSPKGQYQLDKLILKVPAVGTMMTKVLISRFSSTLSILLSSGVDLLSSLNIVEEVVGNKVYSEMLIDTRGQIREGISFARPLADSPLFPGMVVQMVKIGEESGNLEKMLSKITTFYNREVESAVESTIALIEPVMIIFLAVIVGFIVISIMMPMFSMLSLF